jgi:hypothetical protein
VDPRLGTLYRQRKDFEESVTQLNETLAAYLDLEEEKAQAMFPHYLEQHKTDGVEYGIYIGASLVEQHPGETPTDATGAPLPPFTPAQRVAFLSAPCSTWFRGARPAPRVSQAAGGGGRPGSRAKKGVWISYTRLGHRFCDTLHAAA